MSSTVKSWLAILMPVSLVLVLVTTLAINFVTSDVDAARGGNGNGNGGQDVALTGQYLDADVVVNIGYDRADWHFEGNWSGRDLAIQQDCDDGYHEVSRLFHMNGPRGKDGRASLPFPETATSCEGVVVDLDSADLTEASLIEGSSLAEVSNRVMLVK
jgi:hypothetical protein